MAVSRISSRLVSFLPSSLISVFRLGQRVGAADGGSRQQHPVGAATHGEEQGECVTATPDWPAESATTVHRNPPNFWTRQLL